MLKSIFISAHPAGNCQLLLGEKSAVLIDCTVSFCAAETVANINRELGTRKLDAIILSHSHYDHAAGLPWIRHAFPETPVYAHPYVREVFAKPNALSTIHKMCRNAERLYGENFQCGDFCDSQLQITNLLIDRQELPFDNNVLRIIFTPGHTRDSVSVDFPAENITWLCETMGVPRPDGRVQPCFLSGYQAALDSVDLLCRLGKRRFIISHTNEPLSLEESTDYLKRSRDSIAKSAALICNLFKEGKDFEGIFAGYSKIYWSELYRPIWPYEAFSINATAAIKTVLRELCGQQI